MTNQSTTSFFTYRIQIAGLSATLFDLSSGDDTPDDDSTRSAENVLLSLASLKTVDDLIISLDVLGVPGPLTLYAPFLDKIGEGAQFAVFRGSLLDGSTNCEFETMVEAVAVKLPLFAIPAERRLDLTSAKSRRQVHDIYLEIMALRHPALRNHRNIVDLIGWGIDHDWHETPLLVLELAIGDLCSVLAKPDSQITNEITHQLSIDIGQGLDAIHEVGIVHGDLKPSNVLVFTNPSNSVPFIAKLGDFGLSTGEVNSSADSSVVISGMSEDWCAPEIVLGATIHSSELIKADNFSYGLVLLSANCLGGRPPKCKDLDKVIEIVESHHTVSKTLSDLLSKGLPLLLQSDSTKRVRSVRTIMNDDSEPSRAWKQDESDRASFIVQRPNAPYVHPWKLPPLDAYLFLGLEKSLRRYEANLSGPQLFAMFLLRSFAEVSIQDKSLQLDMLFGAVNKGYIPAKAVVGQVIKSYNLPQSLDQDTIKTFLYEGASTGSLLALRELNALDPDAFKNARDRFRDNTGYNRFFSPLRTKGMNTNSSRDADGNTKLHFLLAHGDYARLAEALEDPVELLDINARNHYGETALYKACLTGCWKTVKLLCQHGADSAIPSFLNGLTCLHWLFNFPSTHIDTVLTTLEDSGGDVNALITPIPNIVDYHFPFSWPAGTPLHFAVHAGNLVAITALLKRGARATIRDGRDPYLSDENVRQMHVHGDTAVGETSVPDEPPLGFNAIDLAAVMHDHEGLDCIRMNSQEGELMSPDEEGYTPFHRLSYFRVARTSHGLRFWYPAFRGSSAEAEARLLKTVEALQHLGGNIDGLTATPARPALQGVSGLSPLMIAVTKSDHEGAVALLQCGANPSCVNRDGRTPLMLLAHSSDPAVPADSSLKITELLLRYGATVNCRSFDDITPLGAAISSESMPCIKALIDAGANLGVSEHGLNILARLIHQNNYFRSRLPSSETHEGASHNDECLAEILRQVDLSNSSWVHNVDKDNGSLLHYAAYAGLEDCVQILLTAGLDINQVRKKPAPGSYNNYAGYIPGGTALDVVELHEAQFKSRGQDMMSQEDARLRLQRFEVIKKVLRDGGGVAMVNK